MTPVYGQDKITSQCLPKLLQNQFIRLFFWSATTADKVWSSFIEKLTWVGLENIMVMVKTHQHWLLVGNRKWTAVPHVKVILLHPLLLTVNRHNSHSFLREQACFPSYQLKQNGNPLLFWVPGQKVLTLGQALFHFLTICDRTYVEFCTGLKMRAHTHPSHYIVWFLEQGLSLKSYRKVLKRQQ